LPGVALPEAEQATIGKYGMLRHTYLKTHRRGLYAKLLLSGDHLRANMARSGKGLGQDPTSRFIVFWPQGKMQKIRKCIDTCPACRLAEALYDAMIGI